MSLSSKLLPAILISATNHIAIDNNPVHLLVQDEAIRIYFNCMVIKGHIDIIKSSRTIKLFRKHICSIDMEDCGEHRITITMNNGFNYVLRDNDNVIYKELIK